VQYNKLPEAVKLNNSI